MKRIGIITLWNTKDNYGGVLQNYALQSYLKKKGFDPFLIRYIANSSLLNLKRKIKKIQRQITGKSFRCSDHYGRRLFNEFRNQHIQQSPIIYDSYSKILKNMPKADVYITGSDQVWNYNTFDSSGYPFFLRFVADSVPKIAYAASFGSVTPRRGFFRYISPMIQRFDHISVREDKGVDICNKVERKDVCVVCDPTLLLQRDDYLHLTKDVSVTNPGLHIFCYFLGWETDIARDEIKAYCDKVKMPMRYTPSQGMAEEYFSVIPEFLTIQEWLEAIHSSSFVFTNSYHGTLFSLLMGKPFMVFPLKGTKGKMNSRIHTLLNSVGVNSRIYDNNEPGCFDRIVNEPIDWDIVNRSLERLRKTGTDFLTRCGL